EGVARAEAGANFLEVYRFFCNEGTDPRASYQQTMRIFRGSLPDGCGPFTKDVCYSRGFGLIRGFIDQALLQDRPELIPLLFCGKTSLADLELLTQLLDE